MYLDAYGEDWIVLAHGRIWNCIICFYSRKVPYLATWRSTAQNFCSTRRGNRFLLLAFLCFLSLRRYTTRRPRPFVRPSVRLNSRFTFQAAEWSFSVFPFLSFSVNEYQSNNPDSQVSKWDISVESSFRAHSVTVIISLLFRYFYCFSSLLFQMFHFSFMIPIQKLFQKIGDKEPQDWSELLLSASAYFIHSCDNLAPATGGQRQIGHISKFALTFKFVFISKLSKL